MYIMNIVEKEFEYRVRNFLNYCSYLDRGWKVFLKEVSHVDVLVEAPKWSHCDKSGLDNLSLVLPTHQNSKLYFLYTRRINLNTVSQLNGHSLLAK